MVQPATIAVAIPVGEVVMAVMIATPERPAIVEAGAGMMVGVITTITAMVMKVHVHREHPGRSA
jgi:hypothetical protein